MFANSIIFASTLVLVRARNLNTETIKDHVQVPKYFSLQEVEFARNGEHEELSKDGFHDHSHRGFQDHGSFNVEFNHRQFRRSENKKLNRQDSESSVPGINKSELHDFVMGTFSNRDQEHSSREKEQKERTTHTTESTESDFRLGFFVSETKIKDNNVKEHFDILASSRNQNSTNNNETRNQSKKDRQDIELKTTFNINNKINTSIQDKQKEDELRPSGKSDFEVDQRPIFQTSAKPAVMDNKKETSGDMWAWSDTNSTTSEVPTTTSELDDRAAFTGDKCPTGFIRVDTICAPVD